MPSVTLTALDGGTVELMSPLDVRRGGATSFIVVKWANHLQEFGAGELEYGEFVAGVHEIEFSEEYSLQGGRLRIGFGEHYDPQTRASATTALGVWEGTGRALKTVLWEASSQDVIGVFEQFDIAERPTGIVLLPRSPAVSVVRDGAHAPDVVQYVQGLGLVDVFQLTDEVRRGMPPWAGRRVRGGELFSEDAGPEAVLTLVLAGPSAVARIYPDEGAVESELLERASELEVSWQAA